MANTTLIKYIVHIPGFQYNSVGPIWVDRITIDASGEKLYTKNNTTGVTSLVFTKQETDSAFTGRHYNALDTAKEQLATAEYSDSLAITYGADDDKFFDFIDDSQNVEGGYHHILTVYPNYKAENQLNNNILEHASFCYLQTSDMNQVFTIHYKLESKLEDGSYIVIFDGTQKYSPVGSVITGSSELVSYDKCSQYFDTSLKESDYWYIPLASLNALLPVIKSGNSYYLQKATGTNTYEDLSDQAVTSKSLMLYIYPQWSCNLSGAKISSLDADYLKKVNLTSVPLKRYDEASTDAEITVAPFSKDATASELKTVSARQIKYFAELKNDFGLTSADLLKHFLFRSSLAIANSDSLPTQSQLDHASGSGYNSIFCRGNQDIKLSSAYPTWMEVFSGSTTEKRQNDYYGFGACGIPKASTSEPTTVTFGCTELYGAHTWNDSLILPVTKSWEGYCDLQYAQRHDMPKLIDSDDNLYIGQDRSYQAFLYNLLNHTGNYVELVDPDAGIDSFSGSNTLLFNNVIINKQNSWEYLFSDYTPEVKIKNLSEVQNRFIFGDYRFTDAGSKGLIESADNNNIIVSSSLTFGTTSTDYLLNRTGKDARGGFKLTSSNVMDNPEGEVSLSINSGTRVTYTLLYSIYTVMRLNKSSNTPRMFGLINNAQLVLDITNLRHQNLSDYTVIPYLCKEATRSDGVIQLMGYDVNLNEQVTNLECTEINGYSKPCAVVLKASKTTESTSNYFVSSIKYNDLYKLGTYSETLKTEAGRIYVLQVNSYDTKLSVNINGTAVTNQTQFGLFAFYTKTAQTLNINIISQKGVLKNYGIYKLDSNSDITQAAVIELDALNKNLVILDETQIGKYVIMPAVFCYSEDGNTCCNKTYTYSVLPEESYQHCVAWYTVSEQDGYKTATHIRNTNMFYKYSNKDLLAILGQFKVRELQK